MNENQCQLLNNTDVIGSRLLLAAWVRGQVSCEADILLL